LTDKSVFKVVDKCSLKPKSSGSHCVHVHCTCIYWYICYVENNTWEHRDMKCIFECAHSLDIELEHKKINSYLQASMYYLVYYINISLKSRKKIVEIADWPKLGINTCETFSYQNTCADTIFLSGGNPYNTP
jgi:hypothetical protein